MATAKLDIDALVDNPNARTIIALPGGVQVVGFIQNDIQISGGNDFNNPFENQAQNAINEKLQILQAVAGRFLGDKIRQFTIKTVDQSALFWTGSQIPTFNLQLAFVALREGDDIRDSVEKLYSAVMPTFLDVKATSTINAPLGYLPRGRVADGTITAQIGTWFRASRLVITNVDFTFSQETIENGSPLAAEGSIQLRPFRAISFNEFKSIIRGVGA